MRMRVNYMRDVRFIANTANSKPKLLIFGVIRKLYCINSFYR